jgi:hypothetical protein
VDENLAQVNVAAFTDAKQLRLPAVGVLPWHQSKPRSKVPSLAEGSSAADGCDNGRCHDRLDPWDRCPRFQGLQVSVFQ